MERGVKEVGWLGRRTTCDAWPSHPLLRTFSILFFTVIAFLIVSPEACAEEGIIPKFTFVERAKTPEDVSTTLQILFILTILALAPSIVIMTTCFTRIVIVLSFLRQALATQELPPNQVIIGLSLFLTFMIMSPTLDRMRAEALDPYTKGEITQPEAFKRALARLREFMIKHTRKKDVRLFLNISGVKLPENATYADVPTEILIPAFMISELRKAFIMGFVIFLPFLVIDLVVGSTLISMGMLVLPPILVSLPLKILLFVLVDGWSLVVGSLVASFY